MEKNFIIALKALILDCLIYTIVQKVFIKYNLIYYEAIKR